MGPRQDCSGQAVGLTPGADLRDHFTHGGCPLLRRSQQTRPGQIFNYGRGFMLTGMMFLLAGCFWKSSLPDLNDNDSPNKLVVIWDRVVSHDTLERSSWSTTNEEQLARLTRLMDTKSWESASVLLAGHSTRFIITMNSGKIWEVAQRRGEKNSLSLFNRRDRGWSGWIRGSGPFLRELSSMIEADAGYPVELTKEYHDSIRSGAMKKVIPRATQDQLNLYPGYPELIWKTEKQDFEFAE